MSDLLNFGLTFESGLTSIITAFSRRLSSGLTTDYVLAPDALPHCTVVKVNAPGTKAAEIWQKLLPVLPKRLNLSFQGMTILPGKSGDVWLRLNVTRSAELVLLQEVVCRHLREYNMLQYNIGDAWWPHVTLLHSVDGRMPADWGLDKSLLLGQDVVATPMLGKDVAQGKLDEILYRPDL